MKNVVYWDVTTCGSCKNRRFGGTCHYFISVTRIGEHTVFLCSLLRRLVIANVVPNSLILVTPILEVIPSSETSVLARATWLNIPVDGIFHSHRYE
jgi:hypothetical protein